MFSYIKYLWAFWRETTWSFKDGFVGEVLVASIDLNGELQTYKEMSKLSILSPAAYYRALAKRNEWIEAAKKAKRQASKPSTYTVAPFNARNTTH